jgi:hypothetical protein
VRARRLLTAAAAAAAGFVLFCPWCVLDARVFVSHVLDQAQLKDRWQDGRGWLRYAETAWTTGVGPAACIAFLCAAGAAVAAAFRRVEDWRGPVVLVVAVAAPAAFLAAQQDIAYGRYLMPAFPVAIALGCAWLAGLDAGAGWVRRLGAAAVLAVACVAASGLPARWSEATTPTTRDAAGEWIRANVPDGARVLGDWSLPRLPAVEDREAFRGRVPDATWARYRPAYLLDTAWDYFARPVNRLHGTDAAADDFDAMRRIGPVWIVTSSAGETVLAQLPPGDYPPQRWYEGVRREAAPLVEIAPGPGLRGDVLRISVVR